MVTIQRILNENPRGTVLSSATYCDTQLLVLYSKMNADLIKIENIQRKNDKNSELKVTPGVGMRGDEDMPPVYAPDKPLSKDEGPRIKGVDGSGVFNDEF